MEDPRTTQALRELAEMYLSPRQSPPPQAGAERSAAPGSALRLTSNESELLSAPPELLIAGHMPGPATLWLNQYAQRLTQKHSCLATVHLTDDDVAIDLFGNADIPLDPPAASLPEIINGLASHVSHWLLHLSQPADPFARAAAHQTQHWTLLSGCDEAAVVAGYRTLKQLLEGRPADASPPQISVMFLGCDMHDAQIAFQRLVRTSREHLHLTPVFAGCQQQMLPVRRKRIGHYPLDEWGPDSAELLATITALPIAPQTKPQPVGAIPDAQPAPVQTETPQPQPGLASPRALLASLLPALHPLQARPPRYSQIELALDDSGRLHLLGRDDPAVPDVLPQLLAAKLWAVEHLPLLALTAADLKFDPSADPVQHLFTERAKHFGPLAHLGPPDQPPFKLHLLLPVTVGDHTTHTAVELN